MEKREYDRREKSVLEKRMDDIETKFSMHYEIDEKMHLRTETLLASVEEKLETLTKKFAVVEKIIVAWNNVQGAGAVVRFLAIAAGSIVAIVSPVVAAYLFFKRD